MFKIVARMMDAGGTVRRVFEGESDSDSREGSRRRVLRKLRKELKHGAWRWRTLTIELTDHSEKELEIKRARRSAELNILEQNRNRFPLGRKSEIPKTSKPDSRSGSDTALFDLRDLYDIFEELTGIRPKQTGMSAKGFPEEIYTEVADRTGLRVKFLTAWIASDKDGHGVIRTYRR